MRSAQGRALVRMDEIRSEQASDALQRVWTAADPAAVMAELAPQELEYVELALLTTMTTALCAARHRGESDEAISAKAARMPAPLHERLQAMVREQWPLWRPQT